MSISNIAEGIGSQNCVKEILDFSPFGRRPLVRFAQYEQGALGQLLYCCLNYKVLVNERLKRLKK